MVIHGGLDRYSRVPVYLTRNVFKKDKRRRIKKEENITQARLSTCT